MRLPTRSRPPLQAANWHTPTSSAVREAWARPPVPAFSPKPSTASTWAPMASRATSASRALLSTSSAAITSWNSTPPATTRSTTSAASPTRCASRHRWAVTACSSSTRCTCSRRRHSTPFSRHSRNRPSMPSSFSPLPRSKRSFPPFCRDAKSTISHASQCPTLWHSCSMLPTTAASRPRVPHSMS